MLNNRLRVTRQITIQITELEKELDAVIVKQAQLQVALIEGRRAANLPLDAGQLGMDNLMDAAGMLVAARKAIHTAHYDLRSVRDELHLPIHAYGDSGDTPDSFTPTGNVTPMPALALVDAA